MKNSDEMVKSIFERRSKYIAEKNIKRKKAVKFATSLAVCFTVIISTIAVIPTLINNRRVIQPIENTETTLYNKTDTPDIENANTTSQQKNELSTQINNAPTDSAKENTTSPVKNNDTQSDEKEHHEPDDGTIHISLFNTSPKSPDTDYFGEDELHSVNVILNGNRMYEQIPESEYAFYGIEKTLQKSDFGEFAGTITEIGSYSEAVIFTPCSQEPTLKGCEVYFYKAVNCEAIIIVFGNGHCSLFRFMNFTKEGFSYADEYEVFNVSSSYKIRKIDYKIRKADGTLIVTMLKDSITDTANIDSFFIITKNLKPYTHKNALSGDPEWLNKAREEYKKLDNNKQIIVDASVILNNGLAINFSYQPNLGTGYVPGHYFLSESDNAVMQQLFLE